MLPTLLATLLATGSFDNVLLDTAALDSAAMPPKVTDSPSMSCVGPLEGMTWGLGFRVLGDAPEIMIHSELDSHTSLSLQAILRGHSFDEPADNGRLKGDSSFIDLELSAPWRTRFACQGKVCATASVGPMFRVIQSEGKHSYVFSDTATWGSTTSRSEIRFGLTGSLGATLEIFPNVFLASEMGLKGWIANGDYSEESYYPKTSGIDNRSRKGEISNQGMSSWFGGIGLDVWF